jgi:hypothetical protein
MLDVLKRKRTRWRGWFKKSKFSKLGKRTLLVLAAAGLGMVVVVAAGLYLRPRARGSSLPDVPGALPPTPNFAIFREDALATDPAAPPRAWKYIVIHHSASTRGNAQIFDQAHRERGWRCLGYHFVIGNGLDQGDGVIVAGPRWYGQEAGAHAHSTEHNEYGIGICLVGNFDVQQPTLAQWHALITLVSKLSQRYHIPLSNIVGHGQIRQGGSTACPGKNLHLQAVRDEVGVGQGRAGE